MRCPGFWVHLTLLTAWTKTDKSLMSAWWIPPAGECLNHHIRLPVLLVCGVKFRNIVYCIIIKEKKTWGVPINWKNTTTKVMTIFIFFTKANNWKESSLQSWLNGVLWHIRCGLLNHFPLKWLCNIYWHIVLSELIKYPHAPWVGEPTVCM